MDFISHTTTHLFILAVNAVERMKQLYCIDTVTGHSIGCSLWTGSHGGFAGPSGHWNLQPDTVSTQRSFTWIQNFLEIRFMGRGQRCLEHELGTFHAYSSG